MRFPSAPLAIPGWERNSMWGWDASARSWYADLWRDFDRPSAPPFVSIRAKDGWKISDAEMLAYWIGELAGIRPSNLIMDAMAIELDRAVVAAGVAEEARLAAVGA